MTATKKGIRTNLLGATVRVTMGHAMVRAQFDGGQLNEVRATHMTRMVE